METGLRVHRRQANYLIRVGKKREDNWKRNRKTPLKPSANKRRQQQQQQQQQQQVYEVRGQAVTTQDYANLLQWVSERTLDIVEADLAEAVTEQKRIRFSKCPLKTALKRKYLTDHLENRSIKTASSIQRRWCCGSNIACQCRSAFSSFFQGVWQF